MADAVASLAFLKANWDSNKHDYIENFVPFALHCVKTSASPTISLPALRDAIQSEFGIRIPQHVLQTVVNRAVRQRYVARRDHQLQRNDAALRDFDISHARQRVLAEYDTLLQKITEYTHDHFDLEWTPSDAGTALLAFLDARGTDALGAVVDGRALPSPALSPSDAEFVISRFVTHAMTSDAAAFEMLDTIVRGSFLCNVILYPETGAVTKRFRGATFYFDTKFLLRALGLTTEAQADACRELLGLLHKQHARLACLRHTLDELHGVLRAVESSILYGRMDRWYGETFAYVIDARWSASDVRLFIDQLERKLERLHVGVHDRPSANNVDTTIDEKRLREIIDQRSGHSGYKNPEALDRDVDSLADIFRIRQGAFPRDIESSDGVFVTTNSPMASASVEFMREQYSEFSTSSVPLCILDWVLTTLVWLKDPELAPELPRQRLIADCYAAVQPPDQLWRRFLEEVDKLNAKGDITEDDVSILRYSLTARAALMDVTRGNAAAFSEGTVEEILRRAVEATRAEEARLRKEAERRATALEGDVESLRDALKEQDTTISDNIERGATTLARGSGRFVQALVAVALLFGALLSLPIGPLQVLPGWIAPVAIVLMVAFVTAGVLSLVFGWTFLDVSARVERRVHGRARKFLLARIAERPREH